jgi:hypothetical protein
MVGRHQLLAATTPTLATIGACSTTGLAGLAALAGGDRRRPAFFSPALADAFATLEQQCPDAVPVARWQVAVEDGRRFLGQWDEQASALGWTPDDLFGLHRTAPLVRYDHMGLVWLLHGAKVIALTDSTAAIRTQAGSLLQFYRSRFTPGRLRTDYKRS